jgi:hypothetical protein
VPACYSLLSQQRIQGAAANYGLMCVAVHTLGVVVSSTGAIADTMIVAIRCSGSSSQAGLRCTCDQGLAVCAHACVCQHRAALLCTYRASMLHAVHTMPHTQPRGWVFSCREIHAHAAVLSVDGCWSCLGCSIAMSAEADTMQQRLWLSCIDQIPDPPACIVPDCLQLMPPICSAPAAQIKSV